jgi:flavorubredoxin
MVLDMKGSKLLVLPAHFLHSPGNLQLFDCTSKILYSGDLGASLGMTYREVSDFDAHLKYMEGFHRRYIAGKKAMQVWAVMVRQLGVETIAPQHGALFKGKAMVERFISWCENLDCGMDLLTSYRIPGR